MSVFSVSRTIFINLPEFYDLITKKHIVSTLLAAVIVLPLFPQAGIPIHIMEGATVIASRTLKNANTIPASFDVYDSRFISTAPMDKIDDILRLSAGVNTNRSSGISTMRPSVSLRGLSGDEQGRTLVLIDGVPVNTSDEGGVNWNMIIPETIDRIEILKGPGSTIYGSNAMGGVINIVTRTSTAPLEAAIETSYGTYDTRKSYAGLSGQPFRNTSLFLNGFYNDSDGYVNIKPEERNEYTTAHYVKESGINFKAVFTPTDIFNADLSYNLYLDKRGEGERIEAPDGMYRNFNTNRIYTRILGNTSSMKFRYGLWGWFQREHYFKLDERIQRGEYQRFDVKSDRDDMGLSAFATQQTGRFNSVTVGGEIKSGRVDGGDYYVTSDDVVANRGKIRFFAVYIQDEISALRSRLTLTLGLRYDNARFHDGYFNATGDGVSDFAMYNGSLKSHDWNNFTPKAGLKYNFDNQNSIYTSYSQGFRASILDDLCRAGWMWIGPKTANPELGPEKLYNYEIGFDIYPHKRFGFKGAFYISEERDFLYYVATGEKLWGTRDIYRRENISKVGIRGLELESTFLFRTNLGLTASYTFAASKINEFAARPELEGKHLTYFPKHQFKGSVYWNTRFVDVSFFTYAKSHQYSTEDNSETIAAYATCDLMVYRHFFGRKLRIALSLKDIFDNSHMETRDYISPGRLIELKLTARL